ncbi:ran GTPase-activating protein 1 [Pectinophora gossypiella]|nr:ran GTPase-activating protein 1 [Pectinophora gossypiella]
MSSFDLNSINTALNDTGRASSGVDFSGKSLKLDTEADAKPIVDAINQCSDLQFLTLTGNTLGVAAAQAIAKALEKHPELKICRWSDMFTGRMKSEIPPALKALGDGMIAAGARLAVLDLSDNAFGPIGVEGLAKLLQSEACSQLQELRLNNNGLGITGGKLLAKALSANPIKLKVFIAGRNRLENDGAIALAKVFQQMGTLEEIAMPQNGIYHPGVTALAASFRHNPQLACLNLNDNTIGPKGAAALATDIPQLKNLRSINFGDCLLKSKGAIALAKAFKDNAMQIESLDLSHNEIGREACMELVDSITVLPDSGDRLTRVVLAGNSLGGAANKKTMRDKLGGCAELSDGEGSDDDYETDSDDEEEDDDEETDDDEKSDGEASEDSATEDAQHTLIDNKFAESLDTSDVEEVATDVGRFLSNPTVENLKVLGPNAAEVIDTHLQSIKDPESQIVAYVEATMSAAGLSPACAACGDIARDMYRGLLAAAQRHHAAAWMLANAMLRALTLIKSENKSYQIRWHLPGCYAVLGEVISQPYFPAALRDTLQFFIRSKLPSLPEETRQVVAKCPHLTTTRT